MHNSRERPMKRFRLLRQRRLLHKTPVHSSTSATVQTQFFQAWSQKCCRDSTEDAGMKSREIKERKRVDILQTAMLQQKHPNKQHKAGVPACCRFYRRRPLELVWPLSGTSTEGKEGSQVIKNIGTKHINPLDQKITIKYSCC